MNNENRKKLVPLEPGQWLDDQDDPLDPDLLSELLDRLHVPRRSPEQGKL